jgi:hypothetical protein
MRGRSLGFPAFAWALVACGGGPVHPATVASPVVETASDGDATPLSDLPLAAGGSCEDRARAAPVCLQAAQSRCRSQRGDCEAACEPRQQPGSSEKEPALRGDMEAERCRQGCRQYETACGSTLQARCPTPCGTSGGR